jgi:hypothetical protein
MSRATIPERERLAQIGVPEWRLRALEAGVSPGDHPVLARMGRVGRFVHDLLDKEWVPPLTVKNDYGDSAMREVPIDPAKLKRIVRIIHEAKGD